MQASDWAGRIGDTWAEEWVRTDRTFAPVDAALVAAAVAALGAYQAPKILDVGCGAGRTSLSLAETLPHAAITGIDLSPSLIAAATARASGASSAIGTASSHAEAPDRGDDDPVDDDPMDASSARAGTPAWARSPAVGPARCRFTQGDATVWAGERDVDLLVSRHGVMFFDDPVAAFAHLRTLARPGAPLVFSCFRSPRENVWASGLSALMPASGDPHAPGPFAFADEARVAMILAEASWRDAAAQPLDFDYVAGAGDDPVAEAVDFFTRIGPVARALRDADGSARAGLAAALETLVRDHLADGRIVFPAAAWIWSATA